MGGSLLQMVAMGLHESYSVPVKSFYDRFCDECLDDDTNQIVHFATLDLLLRDNMKCYKIICYNCKTDTLSKIIFKYGSELNLSIGLAEACEYGNYENFLFLLKLVNPPEHILHELLKRTAKAWDQYRVYATTKYTKVVEIFEHLIKMVHSPDYEKLLSINIKSCSSFKLFTKILEIVDNLNISLDINKLFKIACLADNIRVVRFLFKKYPELVEYINSNYDLFIESCNNEAFNSVAILAKVNDYKNYNYYISYIDDCYGTDERINYRVKDNEGNVVIEYIFPKENDHKEDNWNDYSDDEHVLDFIAR